MNHCLREEILKRNGRGLDVKLSGRRIVNIRFWWDLSNVRRLAEPIPCRGNVGMWQLSDTLAAKVEAALGDRGVHASAQDGREPGLGLAQERQGQDGE